MQQVWVNQDSDGNVMKRMCSGRRSSSMKNEKGQKSAGELGSVKD